MPVGISAWTRRAELVAYDRAVRPEPVATGNVHSTATAPVTTGSGPIGVGGGGMGKGGNVTLYCDGKDVGKGRVDQTQGVIFSADETTDIGRETRTTVSRDYTAHTSRFNGEINWVQIDPGEDAEDADHYIDPDERFRIAMARH